MRQSHSTFRSLRNYNSPLIRSFEIKDLGALPFRSLKDKELQVKSFTINQLERCLFARTRVASFFVATRELVLRSLGISHFVRNNNPRRFLRVSCENTLLKA